MTDLAISRARWRRAFLAVLAAWLITAGWAAYALIDQGVTLAYQGDSYEHLRADLATLTALEPEVECDVTRPALLATLRRQHPGSLITAGDSTVGIGQLEFRFAADGRLRAISHPEVPAPSAPAGS